MADLTAFLPGIEAARRSSYQADHPEPRLAFRQELTAAGFDAPAAIETGRIIRVDGPGDKKGKKTGWFIFNEIPDSRDAGRCFGVGAYGSWRGAPEKVTWCSRAASNMSFQETAQYHAHLEQARVDREAELVRVNAEAAAIAFTIWTAASPAVGHAYLHRKQINDYGLRQSRGNLVIPVTVDGHITSLQFIFPDGQKRFLPGGRVKGCYHRIDGDMSRVYIAEGFATGASVAQATGCSVYMAFSAGNLYEVAAHVKAAHPGAVITICADDDWQTDGNPGMTKARQAADGLQLAMTAPPRPHIDFNDMAVAESCSALTAFLAAKPETYEKKVSAPDDYFPDAPGVLADIVNYYHATSGNRQEGFAIQTALAIGSIVLSRSFKTSRENYSSLFLLNVAKSSTGKEHAKTIIEKILLATGQASLIAGDGYTSSGAVFSALLDRPRHISVIDEFGRYLEAGRDMKGGNHNQREANTKLMESVGRAHSIMRPPSYSTMTMNKDAANALKSRMVYNPAITLLGMATPDTLFKTLDMGAIKDGFINRFIISISDTERAVRKHKPPIDVPEKIISWINEVTARANINHVAASETSAVVIEFSDAAMALQECFQQFCVDTANSLDRFHMSELPGRSNEMAMRLSLICALSRDPQATAISEADMEWSIGYIKSALLKTIECLKLSISASDFESAKKEILFDLRDKAPDGVTWTAMQKTAPYSRHKPKDLKEILVALRDADLIGEEPYTTAKGGRPTQLWRALK